MEDMIKPVHIQLKKGDVSKCVLITGDPERVIEISTLLDSPKLINSYRYCIYSGKYKGKTVTIASHGMGAPSLAIAVEELHALGGETFIRFGTCGGLTTEQKRGDLVIPDSAYSLKGGTIGGYIGDSDKPEKPDRQLADLITKNVNERGINHLSGPVFSVDAFYREMALLPVLKGVNFAAIDMECAALFMLARIRRFKAAALLLVVDNPKYHAPFLSIETMHRLGKVVAIIALDTLAAFE